MNSSQDALHAAIRTLTGTDYSLNEDWTALFDQEGIAAGSFEERQLAWINARMGSGFATLAEARNAYAANFGKTMWSELENIAPGNGPTFTSTSTVSVPEDAPDNVPLYTAAALGDAPITFSLQTDPDLLFRIVGADVLLREGSSLNYEAKTSHTFIVRATDTNSLSTDQSIVLTVTDIDEISPSFTSATSVSVDETVGEATVIYTATTDEPCTFTIIDDPDVLFEIDNVSGAVSLRPGSALNYGTKQSHQVTIQAIDLASNTSTLVLTVAVNDVNDHPPVFTSGPSVNVAEDVTPGTVIYQATATDADPTDSVSFSLTDSAGGKFVITGAGAVSLANGEALDFETATSHMITIQATDGTLTANLVLTINVTNVNEGPSITSGASATVAEDISAGTAIYTGTATDPDAGTTFTWSLPNDDGGRFDINSANGEVSLAAGQSLDFETATSHAITIRVSDGTLTDEKIIAINVTDVVEAGGGPAIALPIGTAQILTAGQSITVNKPSSAITGRIGFMGLALNDAKNFDDPTGWTRAWSERNNSLTGACLYRALDGSEAGSETITWSSNELAEMIYAVYEDCAVGTVGNISESNSTSVSAPSVDVTAGEEDGLLLLWFYQRLTSTTAPVITLPSGFTTRHVQNDTLSSGSGLYTVLAEKSIAASGATGDQQVNTDTSGRLIAAQFYLKPFP